eukprot:SM000031S11614  [mRNA]  locus=s31:752353:754351:+ [translate_table: standard]
MTVLDVLSRAPSDNWHGYEAMLATNPVLAKMMISGAVYALGDWCAQCVEGRPLLAFDRVRMLRSGLVGFCLHGSLSHFYYHFCEVPLRRPPPLCGGQDHRQGLAALACRYRRQFRCDGVLPAGRPHSALGSHASANAHGIAACSPMRSSTDATIWFALSALQWLFPFKDWWVVPVKVAFDQTVWSGIWNSIYFVVLASLRLEPPASTARELKATFLPMLVAGWKLWPFAHVITYGVIPLEQRLLWVDMVELVWVTILSTLANQGEVKTVEGLQGPAEVPVMVESLSFTPPLIQEKGMNNSTYDGD